MQELIVWWGRHRLNDTFKIEFQAVKIAWKIIMAMGKDEVKLEAKRAAGCFRQGGGQRSLAGADI